MTKHRGRLTHSALGFLRGRFGSSGKVRAAGRGNADTATSSVGPERRAFVDRSRMSFGRQSQTPEPTFSKTTPIFPTDDSRASHWQTRSVLPLTRGRSRQTPPVTCSPLAASALSVSPTAPATRSGTDAKSSSWRVGSGMEVTAKLRLSMVSDRRKLFKTTPATLPKICSHLSLATMSSLSVIHTTC